MKSLTTRYRLLLTGLFFAWAIVMPVPAAAGTATGTLTVEAGVGTSCTVGNTTLNFGGALVANPASNIDVVSAVLVNCTNLAPYIVDLSGGASQSGNFRRMAFSTNLVTYQLYFDSGHTTVWGGACCGGISVNLTGTGALQSTNVFGRIATGAITTQPAGEYVDSVTVTVTF